MSLMQKLRLTSSVVTYCCLFPHFSLAQVIPDGTTPTTAINGDCLARCDITGGIRADSNLFHSFQEFNIGTGESLYFVDPGVANILSRVTGDNGSFILGTLGVAGEANLWLLNSQGIIFGNGATLDVNGSFVATTADAIAFGERLFSTTPDASENLPLLTVQPSAFFYYQMGQNKPITIEESSLALSPQENLVLLGAQNNSSSPGVVIEDSTLNVPQGKIQIGAVVADGEIPIDSNLQVQFPEDVIAGDITIDRGSQIVVSGIGGGSINIYGAELNIIDSQIFSETLGNVDGLETKIIAQNINLERSLITTFSNGTGNSSNIEIDANSLKIIGNGVDVLQELINRVFANNLSANNNNILGITTSTNNLGAAGTININSNDISIVDGGVVASAIYGRGRGGDINLTATDNIELTTSALTAFSTLESTGDLGNLSIKTERLIVRDGSIVSAGTFGRGMGGDVTIDASESVEVLQTPPNSLIPTTIFTNSLFPNSGDAGDLEIATKNLVIRDGAQISSASGLLTNQGIIPFGGSGGNIQIDATESITVSGSSANGIFPSSIISDTRSNSLAGNIEINTGAFVLEGQAIVSASSLGTGDGGNLTINATKSIELKSNGTDNFLRLVSAGRSGENFSFGDAGGGLFSIASEGNAGNIKITTPVLGLNSGSLISTSALGSGKGGNLDIGASQSIEIINSAILSSSVNTGDAGNLQIDTERLLIHNGSILASSSIGLGKPGDITINATELVELSNDNVFVSPLQGGIFTSNSGGRIGSAGNLSLSTKHLVIRDGLNINTANEIPMQFQQEGLENTAIFNTASMDLDVKPGNSTIIATESIIISGSSANRMFTSSIRSNTETNLPANNIEIVTPQLTVADGADISVNSSSAGAAGSLKIVADRIKLDGGGTLNANTVSSLGGNINLTIADTLQMSDRSKITTNAFNESNGGNITIDTDFLIAFPTSSLTATAISGQGGNITIEAREIFVASPHQISASSQLGIDGEVAISTFTNNLRNNVTKLPEKTLKTSDRVISRCGMGDELGQSSFVYIGKGALPPSLLERFTNDEFFIDWGAESDGFELYSFESPQKTEIVEANQWVIGDRGNVILIAEASSKGFLPHYQTTCPFE